MGVDLMALRRLHAYSGSSPKGFGTSEVDEWLHLSKDFSDKERNHAELYGNLGHLASPDFDISEYPDLLELDTDHFDVIELTWALDYVEWKNQIALLSFLRDTLADQGTIRITTRNGDRLLARKSLVQRLREQVQPIPAWEETQRFLYSSGCPGDWFLCLHTKASLRYVLRQAGFVAVRLYDGDDLVAVGKKIVG